MRRLACLVSLAACAGAVRERNVAAELLDTACAASEDEFAAAWLAHDRRHRDLYAALYPDRDDPEVVVRGPRRGEICTRVRAFLIAAPAVLARQRPAVARLFGSEPDAVPTYTAAPGGADGRIERVAGELLLALNAAHETFGRATGLVITITHELAHAAQRARFGSVDALSPTMRLLYSEGAAVYAVTILFPEVGERATGMPAADLDDAKARRPALAAAFLAALDGDSPHAFKIGYFMGLEVYRRLARTHGPEGALRLSPTAFRAEAAAALAALAAGQ